MSRLTILFYSLFLATLTMAGTAFAQAATLGDMVSNTAHAFVPIQTFLSTLAYVGGIYFLYTALSMTKDYADNPDDVPLSQILLRYAASGLLIASPFAVDLLVKTVTGDTFGSFESASITGEFLGEGVSGEAGGPDEVIVNLAKDLWGPIMDLAIPFLCYVSGLIFMLTGLKRLALGSRDGPEAPGSTATFGLFFTAAALMSIGYMVKIGQGSIFGTDTLYGTILIDGDDSELEQRAENVLWAVFTFLRIFGYISFVRGIFMIKEAAEGGQNGSYLAVGTHIFAGSLLINIGAFIDIIQSTFLASGASPMFTIS